MQQKIYTDLKSGVKHYCDKENLGRRSSECITRREKTLRISIYQTAGCKNIQVARGPGNVKKGTLQVWDLSISIRLEAGRFGFLFVTSFLEIMWSQFYKKKKKKNHLKSPHRSWVPQFELRSCSLGRFVLSLLLVSFSTLSFWYFEVQLILERMIFNTG